ncbi:uncharacterized protein OCT59_010109 [Rhizophagus irregularis]|uniref:F-box domain-containing protein n=2 Tax=Rhizophagus irregularis TaxID=588596 RepID=A0A015L6Y0_RHIIW|nr:hypothetical protein RirG_269660 [Rhizophagus irregularis DAOM 197198w]UZO18800.1 hypothetical protein OCT59_010109 [Rhizophagus irregularis]
MSKFDKDTLFLLFEELQDDSKSLFSCLMVNRLWCETAIPILWRNPWSYGINYGNKNYLFIIIAYSLSDNDKNILTRRGIQLPPISHQSLLFDYLSFCRSFNVNIINNIISTRTTSTFNQVLLRQAFYNLLMIKSSGLKFLDMVSINQQIFYLSGAFHFESLCELKCETSTDSSYFFELAQICQNIQRIIINNTKSNANDGIVRLIEIQENLKYFEWKDNIDDDLTFDLDEKFFLVLEKKANSLKHLIVTFKLTDYYEHLQSILPKLNKLKTLKIDNILLHNEEQLKMSIYHDLEIFNTDYIKIDTAASVIKNSGGHIRKILLKYSYYYYEDEDEDNFDEDFIILIRSIYENCPLIEYLSIPFSASKERFIEFENLLIRCQKLKSILLISSRYGRKLENGDEILKILIRSSSKNLREFRFFDSIKFSLEDLKTFFEKWKGRPAISIITSNLIYRRTDYTNLINKYKNDGVIKEFKYDINLNIFYDN